jgi:uncharacterized membrane protein YbaN (DUF454 family)
MKKFISHLLIVGGTLCVALGALGLFLPLLPTTPFLLLAAVCYGRSSRRLYRWLLTNRCCGECLRNYREGRGLPLTHKVFTLFFLWLTIGYSAWCVVSLWWVKVLLVGIAVGVSIHLVSIGTCRPELRPLGWFKEYGSPHESA